MKANPLMLNTIFKPLTIPLKKSENSSTESEWRISSMRINLWYCNHLNQWRWTLTDDSRPILKQESGQQPFLRDAMGDIANTVEYMLESKQTHL